MEKAGALGFSLLFLSGLPSPEPASVLLGTRRVDRVGARRYQGIGTSYLVGSSCFLALQRVATGCVVGIMKEFWRCFSLL